MTITATVTVCFLELTNALWNELWFVILHTTFNLFSSSSKYSRASTRDLIFVYRGNVGGSNRWLTSGSNPIMLGWSAENRRNTQFIFSDKGTFKLNPATRLQFCNMTEDPSTDLLANILGVHIQLFLCNTQVYFPIPPLRVNKPYYRTLHHVRNSLS
jgi:hypothetical protein